jgi:DNA-binding transcriptional ArsR family regulator
VLSALGHPIRMQVVAALAHGGEHAWGELDVPVANSTLSHHLKLLRESGVVRSRTEGTRCYVSLRSDDLERRFPGLLGAVLSAQPT